EDADGRAEVRFGSDADPGVVEGEGRLGVLGELAGQLQLEQVVEGAADAEPRAAQAEARALRDVAREERGVLADVRRHLHLEQGEGPRADSVRREDQRPVGPAHVLVRGRPGHDRVPRPEGGSVRLRLDGLRRSDVWLGLIWLRLVWLGLGGFRWTVRGRLREG